MTTIVEDNLCEFSLTPIPPYILQATGQRLKRHEEEVLWQVFAEIAIFWEIGDVVDLKSSWLEFIEAKTYSSPDFTAEYSNAAFVVDELISIYQGTAFQKLLQDHGIPAGPPLTRLAHAKRFVVDEFIRAQILLGGFKSFVALYERDQANYQGYIAGSRYNRRPPVRDYRPLS